MSELPLVTLVVPARFTAPFRLAAGLTVEIYAEQVSECRIWHLEATKAVDEPHINEAAYMLEKTEAVLGKGASLYASLVDPGPNGGGEYMVTAEPTIIADVLEIQAQQIGPATLSALTTTDQIALADLEGIKQATESISWAVECCIPHRDLIAAASDPTNGGSNGPATN